VSIGVLVMAHGTPASSQEIDAFYTRIRRGRPPTAEQLADLVARYEAIGGLSPLAARTAAQVKAVTAALDTRAPGRFVVHYGAKHTAPFIEDAASLLSSEGHELVVGLVLAPHRASRGSEEYVERAAAALGDTPFVAVRQWWDAPGFAELVATRLGEALALVDRPPVTVLFSAHSVPERSLVDGDPYPEQVGASADAVAAVAGLARAGIGWEVAWQSAGRTPEPWLGPDLLAELRRLGAGGGSAVVCPIGFVADHLEILYDVDVEARRAALDAGLAFARTASLNDDPRLGQLLARVVDEAVAHGA
jgi:ferrochelatase